MDQKFQFKESVKVTIIGAIVNLILSILKIAVGYMTKANSVMADGIHSLSDLISDALLIIFLKFSYQPPTRNKPYGNLKLESIASILIALILVGVVIGMVWNSIYNSEVIAIKSKYALIVMLISIVSKELVYRYTKYKGKQLKSSALIANAWHHRSDSLSSVMVLFCLIMAGFFGNYRLWDLMGVAMVSIMILHAAWEIVRGSLKELLEHAPSEEILTKIESIVENHTEVMFLYNIKVRIIGGAYHISFAIEINGDKTINESNIIVEAIKQTIVEKIPDTLTVLVQVHPIGNMAKKIKEQGWNEIPEDEFF